MVIIWQLYRLYRIVHEETQLRSIKFHVLPEDNLTTRRDDRISITPQTPVRLLSAARLDLHLPISMVEQ